MPTAGGAGLSRSQRFLERVDRHLVTLPTDNARRAFLTQQLTGWNHRYAAFVASHGATEYAEAGTEPIQAGDFLLTIEGLSARRARLTP